MTDFGGVVSFEVDGDLLKELLLRRLERWRSCFMNLRVERNLKMDKSWMHCTDTSSDVYIKGVDNFLQFSFKHSEVDGETPCPCMLCNNVLNASRADVREHLIIRGIVKTTHVGFIMENLQLKSKPLTRTNKEKSKKRKERSDDMFEMIYDAAGREYTDDSSGVKFKQGDASEPTFKIFKLVEDAAQQLYPGCETFSKLSLIVKLFQIKCLYGLSDKAVDSILKLIKRAVPSVKLYRRHFMKPKK
ncbi:hypothetical protein P3S68_019810 [Capsicum galapagoense]